MRTDTLRVLSLGLVSAILAASAAVAATHWGYSGAGAPEHWAQLDRDNAACATGQEQSPIDLGGATQRDLPNPQLAYQPGDGRIGNDGHTVVVTIAAASTLTLDGNTYQLEQFHFHSPSEHTIGGSSFPAEIHFVNRGAGGTLAVVAVLVQAGTESPALQTLIDAMPTKAGREARLPSGGIDPSALLPIDRRAFRYTGSLTTPPCTEGVSWVVMSTPITASTAQISALARALQGNSRPAQPRGSRELLLDSSP